MKLDPNWKTIATRAWSMRLMFLAVILAGGAAALELFGHGGPVWMQVAAPMLGVVAMFSRVIAQRNLPEFWTDESGSAKSRRVVIGSALAAAVMATALPLVEKWEGLRTEAYRDVIGVWTVCFGETEGVSPGDTYTADECRDMLEPRLLSDYYLPVVQCAPELAGAPVEVQAAVASWTYNVGVGAACRSTLARYLRAEDWRAACNELPRWNRAGGRVWQGLVNRRADERGLCLSGVQ